MATLARIPLGAPGIYPYPDTPIRALTSERLDVCAFLGVAPRGPAWAPVFNEKFRDDVPCVEPERPLRRTMAVAVESFDEYRELYGAFEGPGLLPYAVAAFFEQGGRRAYVARIVHDFNDAALNLTGVAAGDVPGAQTTAGPLRLRARNEGDWGNRLRAAIRFTARPLLVESVNAAGLIPAAGVQAPEGALLRLRLPGGALILRFAASAGPFSPNVAFDVPAPAIPEAAEIVEATLELDDGDGRREAHERLGLSYRHPRWMATILCYESRLVYPDAAWIDGEILPDSALLRTARPEPDQFAGGEDRYRQITPEDFFDPDWVLGNDEPGDGVHALALHTDLGSAAAPDLYSPQPLAPLDDIIEPVSLAGPTFTRCVTLPRRPVQQTVVQDLEGLRLDPRIPSELEQIILYQKRLTDLASVLRSFIVLLDVPPGLTRRRALAWRSEFATSYAAAYLPWLTVSRQEDRRDALIRIPPSAVAAGIMAQRELAAGVPEGPANVLAAGVTGVDEAISPERHDELHPLGINVFLQERDGVRLTAARTLSRDFEHRQLSVRRLLMLLSRTLFNQMQWAVFEPNNAALRDDLRVLITNYLRQLYRAGAFKGATEEQAFFVRCDAGLNPPAVSDAGRLVAEIGVAPSEPLEFIVLRVLREGDGTLTLGE
jgi:hypothetical protein